MTKNIELTQGYFTTVDDHWFEYLNQWKWHVQIVAGKAYARREITVGGKSKALLMHRVISNPSSEMEVDHIDGNTLNNQESNLRNCTHLENLRNRGMARTNKTGYKGVRKVKYGYISSISDGSGKSIHIGFFKNPIDAARAYDKAAKERHGEFAWLNFPE